MLHVSHLTVAYGDHVVVRDVSLDLAQGQWLMLVGPNGAGKSTLLRAVSQGIPSTGEIRLMGQDVRTIRPQQLARQLGLLSQHNSVGYAYTVEEVVSLGRYAHTRGLFSHRDSHGSAAIEHALEVTGLTALRHASVLTLSGGELQRTFLAQIFAQEPQLLLLDEPANHLDLIYQKQLFELIAQWLKTPGRAVLSVVHDLSLARRYGSHALLMHQGECVSQGDVRHVLTRSHLQSVYQMDVYQWMQQLLSPWQEDTP